jgi:dihydroxyacid dehydratase/phosphogluconate dehydratase
LLHGDCLTVTGKTIKQNLAPFKPYPKGQEIIRPIKNPIKKKDEKKRFLKLEIFFFLVYFEVFV